MKDLSARFVLNTTQSVRMEKEMILSEEPKSKCLFPRTDLMGLIQLISAHFRLDLQN